MKERLERRVLGAVRWVDAVTGHSVTQPLAIDAPDLRLVRNGAGLEVVTHARGLETHESGFDLETLPPDQQVPELSIELEGAVRDPAERYLPRRFTLRLPRVASPVRLANGRRPANSLFDPVEIGLLPGPSAPVAASWTQIRVSARDAGGQPLPDLYLRLVTSDGSAVLGRGMTDRRGEGLVMVAGLKLFAPGDTPQEVTTSRTLARLEAVVPGAGPRPVDWTALDGQPATAANRLAIELQAGRTYAIPYPFSGP